MSLLVLDAYAADRAVFVKVERALQAFALQRSGVHWHVPLV